MKKTLLFTAAAIIGIVGGLYLATGDRETPGLPERDFAEVQDMREGDMLKLQFGVKRGSDVVFSHEDGSDLTLAAFEGDYVVLNFWATWCAPCRKEMPHLSELQSTFGDGFEVVTVATGLNQRPAMQIGLPVTLGLDPDGHEIARLIGDANWASDNAQAILRTLMNND